MEEEAEQEEATEEGALMENPFCRLLCSSEACNTGAPPAPPPPMPELEDPVEEMELVRCSDSLLAEGEDNLDDFLLRSRHSSLLLFASGGEGTELGPVAAADDDGGGEDGPPLLPVGGWWLITFPITPMLEDSDALSVEELEEEEEEELSKPLVLMLLLMLLLEPLAEELVVVEMMIGFSRESHTMGEVAEEVEAVDNGEEDRLEDRIEVVMGTAQGSSSPSEVGAEDEADCGECCCPR